MAHIHTIDQIAQRANLAQWQVRERIDCKYSEARVGVYICRRAERSNLSSRFTAGGKDRRTWVRLAMRYRAQLRFNYGRV